MVELFGFWQDEDFFLPVARELRDNIKINVPLEGQYQQMQEKICNTNSVCIGARLYEDNGRDHTTEAEDSFRVLMQRAECMESVLPEAHFFIFSSSENKILEEADDDAPPHKPGPSVLKAQRMAVRVAAKDLVRVYKDVAGIVS